MFASRFLQGLIWLSIAALARPHDGPAKLFLPNPVQVRGVVVDGAGAPISDVRIDHIALTSDSATADSSGHFEFEAKGPSVVFRKKGWTSRLVRVSHNAAPSWGGPEPRTQEIWDSVEFSETRRETRGYLVLDARGKTSDGKLWRWIGQSGESVFYFGQEQKDAMLFDRVLDGLCTLVANR